MRIAATSELVPAAAYRLFLPLGAMQQRRHEIVLPNMNTGFIGRRELLSCDVAVVLRCHDPASRKLLREARDQGVGIIWDVDDDIRNGPYGNQERGSVRVRQQIFQNTVKAARLADVVITSTDALRDLYASAGIKRIEVLENYLVPGAVGTVRRRPGRDGGPIVIGWVAGREHASDARTLAIANTLARIQQEHPRVHVECIGVDLRLGSRYTHTVGVPFTELLARTARWDIALAPIAETTFNAARSNVKVKEYAAACVPWLASSRGPYARLGEEQGGRLVDDDRWYEAIDALVRDPDARERLGRAGRSWAKGQTFDAVADRYEALILEAASRRVRRAA